MALRWGVALCEFFAVGCHTAPISHSAVPAAGAGNSTSPPPVIATVTAEAERVYLDAVALENGVLGRAEDGRAAAEAYERACDLGHPNACQRFASMADLLDPPGTNEKESAARRHARDKKLCVQHRMASACERYHDDEQEAERKDPGWFSEPLRDSNGEEVDWRLVPFAPDAWATTLDVLVAAGEYGKATELVDAASRRLGPGFLHAGEVAAGMARAITTVRALRGSDSDSGEVANFESTLLALCPGLWASGMRPRNIPRACTQVGSDELPRTSREARCGCATRGCCVECRDGLCTRRVPHAFGARELALGDAFGCAVIGDGDVRCWGDGRLGQRGPGVGRARSHRFGHVESIAAGSSHVCVLVDDGAVHCWGSNDDGQLGGASTTRAVPGLPPARALALTALASCARLTTGEVRCWGGPPRERASTVGRSIPKLNARLLAGSGSRIVCALDSENALWCWEPGRSGPMMRIAERVAGAIDLEVSDTLACARIDDGRLRCFALKGGKEQSLEGIVSVVRGGARVCGVDAEGSVGCCDTDWRSPGEPRCEKPAPPFASLGDVVKFASGWSFHCALLRSGEARCWGEYNHGQLGY
jgi:hypothetical protein